MTSIVLLPWFFLMAGAGAGLLGYRQVSSFLAAAAISVLWMLNGMSVFAMLYCLSGLMLAAITPIMLLHYRRILSIVIVIWGCLLALHLLPGIANLPIVSNIRLTPDSLPFSLSLNFDKPMLFFGLLIAFPALLGTKKPTDWKTLGIAVMLLISLIGIAYQMGIVKMAFKTPAWLWMFAANNLLLVCTAEEALFRGCLQPLLIERWGKWPGLLAASILFGAVHLMGGVSFAVLACLAGLAYGLVFYATNRLNAAIFTHFSFNMIHLIFFTYPCIQPPL